MSRSPRGLFALSSRERGEGKGQEDNVEEHNVEELRALTAPWVLPIAAPPLREGAVVLGADDVIVWVGPRADLDRSLPEERIDGALLPGLVNAHTHLELSHLAGQVPGGGGVPRWATELVRRNGRGASSAAAAVNGPQAAVNGPQAAVNGPQATVNGPQAAAQAGQAAIDAARAAVA